MFNWMDKRKVKMNLTSTILVMSQGGAFYGGKRVTLENHTWSP